MHNVPKNSETHFKVVVVSDSFVDKKPLERHKMVNGVLKDEVRGQPATSEARSKGYCIDGGLGKQLAAYGSIGEEGGVYDIIMLLATSEASCCCTSISPTEVVAQYSRRCTVASLLAVVHRCPVNAPSQLVASLFPPAARRHGARSLNRCQKPRPVREARRRLKVPRPALAQLQGRGWIPAPKEPKMRN